MNVESQREEIGRVPWCREDIFWYLEVSFADLEEDVGLEKLTGKSGNYDESVYAFATRVNLRAYDCRTARPYIVSHIPHQFVAGRGSLSNISKLERKMLTPPTL